MSQPTYSNAIYALMKKMEAFCRKHNPKSFRSWQAEGVNYLWQPNRRNHEDGAMTGEVWKECESLGFNDPEYPPMHPVGKFKISPDGTVERGPKVFKDMVLEAQK